MPTNESGWLEYKLTLLKPTLDLQEQIMIWVSYENPYPVLHQANDSCVSWISMLVVNNKLCFHTVFDSKHNLNMLAGVIGEICFMSICCLFYTISYSRLLITNTTLGNLLPFKNNHSIIYF